MYMKNITQEVSEHVIEETLRGIEIPSPPQLIIDLQTQMELPGVKIETIAELIRKDVGISGKVIKLINSPFFGLCSKVTSINHAINLLGLQNIINIVNSIALPQSFNHHKLTEMTRFWDNATDVAMASIYISRVMGIAVPDEAYTLGLFHNAGVALLIERFPKYLALLKLAYSEQNCRVTDIENHKINCNHAVAGYYVAKSWKLPVHITEAIADHHKTQPIFSNKIPCEEDKKNLLAILKLAETICKTYKTFGNEATDYEFENLKDDLFSYLEISEYEFEEMKAEMLDIGITH